MSHLFEAFVDIMEYGENVSVTPTIYTERYEVDASSKHIAGRKALYQAGSSHPTAAELDVRVTRILQ